jgi:MFS family permease
MSDVNPRLLMVACVFAALVASFTVDLYAAVPEMSVGRFGVDLSSAPSWTAFSALGWALGQFFSGRLLDFGVRRGLSIAILGAVVFSSVALFAPTFEIGLILRLISGMCAGVSFAAIRIFLRQVCVDEGLGKMMATFSIAFLGGVMMAPVVGVFAFKYLGFWGVVSAHALLCLATLPTLWFLPQKTSFEIAPASEDPRGVELPTWVAQCVQGSNSFLCGVIMAFFPIVLIENWGSADWLPAFTVVSLLLGMALSHYNKTLLNKYRLLYVMSAGLVISVCIFALSLVLDYAYGAVFGVSFALIFGIPFFATSGSNAEAISLSRSARSYSELARRRAIPVTLGNIAFVGLSLLSQKSGVSVISVWPHFLVSAILVLMVVYFLRFSYKSYASVALPSRM